MQARHRGRPGTLLSLHLWFPCSTTCRRTEIDTRLLYGRQKGTIAASSIKKSPKSVNKSKTKKCMTKKTSKKVEAKSTKSETKRLNQKKGEAKQRKVSFWQQDRTKILALLDKAESHIGITKPEDWYSVNLTELHEIGLPISLRRTQLAELLREKYPDYDWEAVYLLRGKYAQQKRAEKAIRLLFPDEEIKINVRKEAELLNPTTGNYLELDIYLPSLKLAFEYHELQHYVQSDAFDELRITQDRDAMKLRLAKEKGITLIVIPCWWDGKLESLIGTIRKSRLDIIIVNNKINNIDETKVDAIPEEMPSGFVKKVEYPPDIGEPSNARFMTLTNVNPEKWWIFEKYDGVRGLWNPLKKAMYSRQGKVLPIPEEILKTLPDDTFLDGELWFGRGNFQQASLLVKKIDQSEIDWAKFKYMVFDIPNGKGSYSERYKQLEERIKQLKDDRVEVAGYRVCEGIEHLEDVFQDILDKGGEGIILRDPHSIYEPGRSKGYLKHKKFRDAEARIVSIVNSYQYECELPNGVKFMAAAGTKEFAKRYNDKNKGLKVGDIVSFKHRGFLLGSKKPKVATLYRVRHDLTWQDVLNNWKEQTPSLPVMPVRRIRKRIKQRGYWLMLENRKKFFTDFANEMGFDPMDIEKWKHVTTQQIVERKGHGLLGHYGNSVKKALLNTFPEFKDKGSLRLRKEQQDVKEHGFWRKPENRRQFFIEFAKEKGFDPLDVNNWIHITKQQIEQKQGYGLLAHFGNSLKKALLDSFPEFAKEGLDEEWVTKGYWKNTNNQRKFFEDIAHQLQFDPSDMTKWDSLRISSLVSNKKGGKTILNYYNGSWQQAVHNLFQKQQQQQQE